MKPEVVNSRLFDMQVCIPKDWDDSKIIDFAELNNPSNIPKPNGWKIRKDNKLLQGAPIRINCDTKNNFVHVMLDV